MASLVQTLTASGGPESPGFLNDLVKQLWPNMAVAIADSIKQTVEPMFDAMLPAPLNTLHFVKVDLGHVPIHLENVDVHSTENGGIKLDMDVLWDGACDIELDGKLTPKIGVEHLKLYGRLSILLCPLTSVLPCVGALQVAFINKPTIKMTYTDAASIASLGIIDSALRRTVTNIIASMAVLPNRFLVKLDAANDWFRTYQHPLGVLRLTVESGADLGEDVGAETNILKKLVHDVPDCFATVTLSAAEPGWRTRTVRNSRHPEWRQTHDFLVADHDQAVELDVKDRDMACHDDIGVAATSVRRLLLAGGRQELPLTHAGAPTGGRVTVSARFYRFVPDLASLSSSSSPSPSPSPSVPAPEEGGHDGQEAQKEEDRPIVGLLSVLVAGARGLRGRREQLRPSDETGAVEVPLDEVLRAPDLRLEKVFDLGSGVKLSAAVWLRGVRLAE
ncbi:hypothetical protein VTH06DRAFT_8775 [Thermothelomyces fergusii]